MSDDKEWTARRNAVANMQGDSHAAPILRSMYPSVSRGEMATRFARLFISGADWARAEAQAVIEMQGLGVEAVADERDQALARVAELEAALRKISLPGQAGSDANIARKRLEIARDALERKDGDV